MSGVLSIIPNLVVIRVHAGKIQVHAICRGRLCLLPHSSMCVDALVLARGSFT